MFSPPDPTGINRRAYDYTDSYSVSNENRRFKRFWSADERQCDLIDYETMRPLVTLLLPAAFGSRYTKAYYGLPFVHFCLGVYGGSGNDVYKLFHLRQGTSQAVESPSIFFVNAFAAGFPDVKIEYTDIENRKRIFTVSRLLVNRTWEDVGTICFAPNWDFFSLTLDPPLPLRLDAIIFIAGIAISKYNKG